MITWPKEAPITLQIETVEKLRHPQPGYVFAQGFRRIKVVLVEPQLIIIEQFESSNMNPTNATIREFQSVDELVTAFSRWKNPLCRVLACVYVDDKGEIDHWI